MTATSADPTLHVYLDVIRRNATTVCTRLPRLEIVGVAKVTCGDPRVAGAMIKGGVTALGDSRLQNLERLRRAHPTIPLWLLRAGTPAQAAYVVNLADVSLNSEPTTLRALDAAAGAARRRHHVVIMVDMGDLREGVMPGDLAHVLAEVRQLRAIRVVALGTNLTCYGAVVPTPHNLGELVALTRSAESLLGYPLGVSGGNSSSLELALANGLPPGITNLRVGESILLGVSTITRLPLPPLAQNAFVLEAPVVECGIKPSHPLGQIAQDAFGNRPVFTDRGERRRAICPLGRQDCVPEGLQPLETGVHVLGGSSDHLILDVEDMVRPPAIGETLRFRPNYGALLAASTSPYVRKCHHGAA